MQITLTPEAITWLQAKNSLELTIVSLVFSSCCSGPLPPEVKPGAPADADGFTRLAAGDLTVYYDTLLDEQPLLTVDLMDYGKYKELVLVDWPLA